MPLHLSQLTRREFLKRAALAGVGLGLVELTPTKSYAGLFGKSRDKHTFAFFSDTHIAADVALDHSNVNMAANLTACVRELAAWPVKPATVIVNGDLAFRSGLTADYGTFGRIFEPIRALAPVHLLLGNHDDRENCWQAFRRDATKQSARLHRQATVFASDRANWFLLDSLDVTGATPGEFGAPQLDWLERELAARPDKPAILVGHHNLQVPGDTPGLKDSAAFEELFARHRQVKVYIFGHTHDWHVESHASGVQLVNLPPTGYVFKEVRPSGWVRMTLARDGAEFELRSLDPHHPEHAQVKQLQWRSRIG